MSESQRERKRRKWDVAAAVPLSSAAGLPGQNAATTMAPSPAASVQSVANASPSSTAQPPAAPSAPTADVIARAKLGAMSVLEKINKDLRAKGSVPMRSFGLKTEEERIRCDVSINDAPGPIRYNLTRRATQDDIARRTGTQIVVRGQYQPPGVPITTPEPPLFLKITPGAITGEADAVQQYAVDVAAGEVKHIISGGVMGTYRHNVPMPGMTTPGIPPPQQSAPHFQPPGNYALGPAGMPRGPLPGSYQPPMGMSQAHNGVPYGAPMQPAKPSYANVPPPDQIYPQQAASAPHSVPQAGNPIPLYVGFTPTQDFDAISKLRGPENSFLRHIATKTGATVDLGGRGSGGTAESSQPLHILVSAGTQGSTDAAVKLAKSLIDTVKNDFERTHPAGTPQPQSAPAPVGQQLPYGSSYMPSQHLHPQQAPPLASQPPYSHPQPGQPYGFQQPPAQAPNQAPFYTPQQPHGQARPPSFPSALTSSGYAPFNQGQMQAYPSQGPYNQQGPNAGQAPSGHIPVSSYAPPPAQFGPQAHVKPQVNTPLNPHPGQQTHQGNPNSSSQASYSTSHNVAATQNASDASDQQKEGGRRRFKEVKDTPPSVPSQPAPYAPAPVGSSANKASAPTGISMGPPATKHPGAMAPPPPRNPTSMGPPPARPRQLSSQGSGNANASNVSGALAGLVDYE